MKKTRRSLLLCLVLLVISLVMAISACNGGSSKVEFKFDTQGGEPIASVTLEVGEEYTLPTPVWEGHSFVGWFDNAEGTGSSYTAVKAEKSMTFYAKWEALSLITLELDGGSLSATKLYLRAGENLYTFMSAYVPVKEGFEFGAWYVGETELSRGATMPQDGITLTARYKVGYTVETYLQNLALNGYERGEDLHGFEYAGTNFSPDPIVEGFTLINHADAVRTKVLTNTPSENVFKLYFDRDESTIVFNSNYPAPTGLDDVSEVRLYLYGSEAEFPVDLFAAKGYCLVGWATSPDGEVVYESGYIASKLYGKQEAAPKAVVGSSAMLFAVWERGYINLFESKDYVYIFEDAEVAYLERGGVFFAGEYNARRNSFLFRDGNGKVLLEGSLRGDGTYAYYDVNREGYATLYTLDRGIIESTRIFFDSYDQIIYSVEDENGVTSTSEGTYRLDESGFYVAKFTTGEMSGRTIYFDKASVSVGGSTRTIFQIRNEEEYALGELIRFGLTSEGTLGYSSIYQLTLNGMNVCALNVGSGYEYYYYLMVDDLIALYDANLSLLATFKLIQVGNVKGYMPYRSALDGEFTSETGATLTLDGLYNATYKDGSTTVSGYYTATESMVGGYLITFYGPNKTTRIFHATVKTETVGTNRVTVRSFEERGAGYAEFYFKDADPDAILYYIPLIVLDENAEGEITVYGMNSAGNFVKIASGRYTRNEESGLYMATLESHEDVAVIDMPIDVAAVNSFVFSVTTLIVNSGYYPVAYWYSVTTEEGTTNYDKTYTEVDGDSKLTTVATFVIYEFDEYTIMGTFMMAEDNPNLMICLFSTGSSALYLYFEIDEENGTFVWLTDMLGSAVALLTDGTADENEVLTFDGKGGVTYTITNGEDVTTYTGTYADTERTTLFEMPIYLFTAEGMSFEFILISTNSASYFARYNEAYNGEYTGTYGGYELTLTLDGYTYLATLTVGEVTYAGIYYMPEEDVVCLVSGSAAFYFDITDDRTFTMRSGEYGSYLLYDNGMYGEIFLTLDGYGKLTVYTYEETEEGEAERVELGVGVYTVNAEGLYELTYEGENGRKVYVGFLGTLNIGSYAYRAFLVMHEEVIYNYVIESDWSMLMLDGLGNARMLNAMGEVEYGSYTLITDSILYYVNNAGTEANIYEYDKETATAVRMTFDQIGYYTETLESLLFTNYGFMVMGGTTRYYYNMDEKGNVLVYHAARAGEVGNEYGYVEENFGQFENVINWNGKTYFQNSGYALMFKRGAEGNEKYPVTMTVNGEAQKFALGDLVFTPSGGTTFSVSGSVTINGKNYSCSVVRLLNEEGETETYIVLGSYVFGIAVNYQGMNDDGSTASSYEIISMRTELGLYSNNYLYLVLLYAMNGRDYGPNDFGYITVIDEYDENGDIVEDGRYMIGHFYEHSGMRDSKGNLVSAEKLPYTLEKNVYVVNIQGEDGYLYRLNFQISSELYRYFGVYGYVVQAFTRVEGFDLEDGYRVEIERAIVSDSETIREGSLISVKVLKGEEVLEADFAFIREGVLYYLVQGAEQEDYTEITYYFIELVENLPDAPADGETLGGLNTYKSATLKAIRAYKRYYSNKLTFVDFDAETDEALLLVFNNGVYVVESTEANEDGSYLLTTVSGVQFFVVKGGMIGMYTGGEEGEEEAA